MMVQQRKQASRGGIFAFAIIVGLQFPISIAQAVGTSFSPPVESFSANSRLPALQQDLAQGDFSDAALRIDALLAEHADELMTSDSGGLIAFGVWVKTLPESQQTGLRTEYRKRFDVLVAERLEAVRQTAGVRPRELYEIARRYPLSSSAPLACALAAERALELGDHSAALTFYELATEQGWRPTDAQQRQIDLLKHLAAGQFSSDPQYAGGYNGPVPFEATWLSNAEQIDQGRYFPMTAAGHIYLPSSRYLMAITQSGQLAWSFMAPYDPANSGGGRPQARVPRNTPTGKLLPDRINEAHRPAIFKPALLLDMHGTAQVVIVRQPSDRENEFLLRAFRARDGKLLWASDDQPQLRDLSFASTPVIAGSLTYAVAMLVDQPAHNNATVVLAALDTMSGQLQWQATVGVFTVSRERKAKMPAIALWDDVWEQSEPLVSGDAVYLTPNAGEAIKADRFDGKVRWMHPYAAHEGPVELSKDDLKKLLLERKAIQEAARQARNTGAPLPEIKPPPLDPAVVERYTSTPRVCGQRVVIAPADSFGVFALDILTGRQVWEKKDVDVPTLVGSTATAAIFAGAAVVALDAANGQTLWRWAPPAGRTITGPVILHGDRILVPTGGQTMRLDSIHGTEAPAEDGPFAPPNWSQVMDAAAVRTLLETAGAAKSFVLPDAPPLREP